MTPTGDKNPASNPGSVATEEKTDFYVRPSLENLDLPLGKRTRLHRLMYEHGPGHGTLVLLPIDQGLEHGPIDFFDNPASAYPEYQVRLVKAGGFSGVAFQIGLAQKYLHKFAGEVPLVVKLNGKTGVPPDDEAFSPLNATVEDAIRLGADAVGYTIYVGSPAQDRDLAQLRTVRQDCDRFGMPLILWAYPRGKYIEARGGRDSVYAVDYACRVADEVGADVVKINLPKYEEANKDKYPGKYKDLALSPAEAIKKVIRSAGKTMVIVSGGSKISDDQLLENVRIAAEAGCVGFIFGRNIWQRKWDDALRIAQRIKDALLMARGIIQ